MIQTQVRRQGGAAITTIPAELLKQLHAEVGSIFEIDVVDGSLIARPKRAETKRRYTLEELLQGMDSETAKAIKDETEWFREGEPTGRELL